MIPRFGSSRGLDPVKETGDEFLYPLFYINQKLLHDNCAQGRSHLQIVITEETTYNTCCHEITQVNVVFLKNDFF